MAGGYVLITPARDEARYIEHTLRSVVAQTLRPLKWVIVSDGSTDGTDALVERCQAEHPFIELVRLPARRERHFAAKVQAFEAGLRRVEGLDYEVLGCLDADVSFEPDYMAFLLSRFEADAALGVAGTHYVEGDFDSYADSYIDSRHVNGQCQLFRRACYADIGGYQAIRGGGIDWVAVTSARMRGWTTRSYAERTFRHHRPMGTAGTGTLGARFHYGRKDYFLGGHPLWQLARSLYQTTKPPYLLGGAALLAGYLWCALTEPRRPIPAELIEFHREEQLARLRDLVRHPARLRRARSAPPAAVPRQGAPR